MKPIAQTKHLLRYLIVIVLLSVSRMAYADDPYSSLSIYFASLHSHTVFSDDARTSLLSNTPDRAFSSAKGLLDILAITDHAELLSPHAYNGKLPTLLALCLDHWIGDEWQYTADAAAEASTPTFLGLRGFEWSADGGQSESCVSPLPVWTASKANIGHINVFGTSDYVAHHYVPLSSDWNLQKDTLKSFFKWIDVIAPSNPNAVCQFNHPNSYSQFPFKEKTNFGYGETEIGLLSKPPSVYHNVADPNGPFALIELNGHQALDRGAEIGAEDFYQNTTNVALWQKALQVGWHLAPTYNEDNHFGGYGEKKFRTGIWSSDLSETGVLQAMRARHVYATPDPALQLKFWVETPGGNVKMGETATVNLSRIVFRASLNNGNDYQFKSVRLIAIRANHGLPGASGIEMDYSDFAYSKSVAAPNDIICYYVRAVLNDGGLAFSAPIWIQSNALSAPQNLVARADSNTTILLTWDRVDGADKYYIYRGTTSGGEGQGIYNYVGQNYQSNNQLSYDFSVVTGTTYYYQVTAVNTTGESPRSAEVAATPGSALLAAPSLTGSKGDGYCKLTWTAIIGATSYNVYRSRGPFGSPIIYKTGVAKSPFTTVTFLDLNVTNGSTYTYYVAAVNASGEGNLSNLVDLTPGVSNLSAPVNVVARADSNTTILLTWDRVDGADKYYIYRGTTSGGEGQGIYNYVGQNYQSNNQLSYDFSVVTGTTYYYQVTAVNTTGESPRSAEVAATPGAALLAAPSLTGSKGDGYCKLTWTTISGATSYNVYRSRGPGGSPRIYKTGVVKSPFSDLNVTNGSTYTYYVAAVNASGEGNLSNLVDLTPGVSNLSAPVNVVARADSNTTILLTWDRVDGADKYYIYRGTTSGGEGQGIYNYVGQNYQSNNQLSYDFSVVTGTTYYYQVTAVNTTGESPRSAEVAATPGAALLAAPSLTGSKGDGYCKLTWTTISGATSYNVYRSRGPGGSPRIYKTGVVKTSFLDLNVTNGSTYTYYVAAVNASGEGNLSNLVDLTP